MEWIGVIGIVVGLVFFVVAAMRGWNVLITSIVTAIVIALTNGMDIMSSMVGTETSYVTGLAGFLRGNLIIFMGGAIMGEFMDKSGAAKSIAQAIMNKVGTKSPYMVLLGISLIGALLTYAGISMFVAMFALIPLARPMFRECDIPWPLFCAAWTLGTCSFTMAMIPGVPAIAWINAANGCGVSLTAAPIMGIVGSIIAITVSCLIIKFSLKRAQARGEHFVATEDDIEVEEDKNIPNLFLALLPLILLIATIIGLSATGMKNVVYIGMLVGIIASIACFFKFVPSVKDSLGAGAVAGVGPAVFTSAAVGVGTVAAASVGFSVIYGAIFNMPGGSVRRHHGRCPRWHHGFRLGRRGHHRPELPAALPGNGCRSRRSGEDHRNFGHHWWCASQLGCHVRHALGHEAHAQEFLQVHRRHLHRRRSVRVDRHDHHGKPGHRVAPPFPVGASHARGADIPFPKKHQV